MLHENLKDGRAAQACIVWYLSSRHVLCHGMSLSVFPAGVFLVFGCQGAGRAEVSQLGVPLRIQQHITCKSRALEQ